MIFFFFGEILIAKFSEIAEYIRIYNYLSLIYQEMEASRLARTYRTMFPPRTRREEAGELIANSLIGASTNLRQALRSRSELKDLTLPQVRQRLTNFYEKDLERTGYPEGGFTESGFEIEEDEDTFPEYEILGQLRQTVKDNIDREIQKLGGTTQKKLREAGDYDKAYNLERLKDKARTNLDKMEASKAYKEFMKLRTNILSAEKNFNKGGASRYQTPKKLRNVFKEYKEEEESVLRTVARTKAEEPIQSDKYTSIKGLFRKIAKLEIADISYPYIVEGQQIGETGITVRYVIDKPLSRSALTQSLYYHLNVYPTDGLDASNYQWTVKQGYGSPEGVSLNTTITGEKFKDDPEEHCFYDCLIRFLKSRMKPTNSPKTNQRYRLIIDKALELREIDKFGVPYVKLQERANALPIQIIMKDIEGNKIEIYTPNRNYNNISFTYVRTRPNHLEPNLDFANPEFKEELTQEELCDLYEELRSKNKFGLVEYTKQFPPKIKSINDGKTKYVLYNPELETIQKGLEDYQHIYNTFTKEQYDYFKTGMSVPYQRSVWYPDEIYYAELPEEEPKEIDPLDIILEDGEEPVIITKKEIKDIKPHQLKYSLMRDDFLEKDMTKAYTQFKHNPHYEKCKFPAIPTDLCSFDCFKPTKEWLENHNGVFTFSAYLSLHKDDQLIFSPDLHYVKWFLERVGFKTDGTILTRTNIQLLFLLDIGCEIKIHKGLFTTIKTDFEFSDLVMKEKLYAKATGVMDYSMSLTKTYQIIPNDHITPDFLKSLQPTLKGKINVFNNIGSSPTYTYTIKRESNIVSNLCHISAFIYDYCFTTVLYECFTHKLKNIVALKLDSIVYLKDPEDPPSNPLFRPKETKLLSTLNQPFIDSYNYDYDNYTPRFSPEESEALFSPYEEQYDKQYILCNGMGGCGKTTTIGNRKGIISPIGCALQWINATTLERNFNMEGHSLARMLGQTDTEVLDLETCEVKTVKNKNKDYFTMTKRRRHPPNIIIDEITMLKHTYFTELTKKYPYSKMYFCGDFSLKTFKPFQTFIDNHGGNFIKHNLSKFSLVSFDNDYRAKDCPRLKKLKLDMRDIMEEDIPEDKMIFKTLCLLNKTISTITLEMIKDNHTKDNGTKANIIVSTNAKSNEISQFLNWPQVKITNHSFTDIGNAKNGKECYLKGQIYKFLPDIPESRFEVRSAFTIHSFQGMTIPKDEMLYIDTEKIFQIQLLYTAISRAQNINQIRLIGDTYKAPPRIPIRIGTKKIVKVLNLGK